MGLHPTDFIMFSPMISNARNLEQQGEDPPEAEIDRADLRITELARPVAEDTRAIPLAEGLVDRQPGIGRGPHLHAGEEILVFKHG